MPDISWLTIEAKSLHEIFVSVFYSLATVLLLIGVALEYFKFPIGGGLQFAPLLGRAVIASILLIAYPDISNAIANVGDDLAQKVGDLNSYKVLLSHSGKALASIQLHWSSPFSIIWTVFVFISFYALHITVFFFDAAILYGWVLLFVFSPLLIVCFILPVTASVTSTLFRSLFELASWKIVWSVIGTLLWSSALHQIDKPGEINIISLITLHIILALSLILTPIVVHGLTTKGIASVGGMFAGVAAAALATPVLGPAGLAALATAPMTLAGKGIAKGRDFAKSKLFPDKDEKKKSKEAQADKKFDLKPPAHFSKIPSPTEPPGWLTKRLERESGRYSPPRTQRSQTSQVSRPMSVQQNTQVNSQSTNRPATRNTAATPPPQRLNLNIPKAPSPNSSQQKPTQQPPSTAPNAKQVEKPSNTVNKPDLRHSPSPPKKEK